MALVPWDGGIPSLYYGDVAADGWIVAHLNTDYPQVSLVRADGSAWRTLNLFLYDIGITKDRDGVTDLIIGVSVDRRGIFLYNPATGSLENTMIYDTGDVGSIFRPTMGAGHTIVFAMVRNGTIATWKMERGDGYSVTGLVNNAFNPMISIDGTWFLCSAFASTWTGWQGEPLGWHQEILSYNIGGDYTNLTGGSWLTMPWQNANYPDCDFGTLGQWAPSYGEYFMTATCGQFLNPTTGAAIVDYTNVDNYPNSHSESIIIWAPNPAGGTYHYADPQRYASPWNPHQSGYWVGPGSPVRGSHTREEYRGDPGWVSSLFANPQGMGIVTYCVGMPYAFPPPAIAVNGSRARLSYSHNSMTCSLMYEGQYADAWGVYAVGWDPGPNVWYNGGI